MQWWREARLGMFIHWGLYCVPAGTWAGKRVQGLGEWIMQTAKITVEDYTQLAAQFEPVEFHADQWVSIAKSAGMKYIVITAKHHDGFAMYQSRVDKFNMYDATPFRRDPIAELAHACKRHGLKLGVYYSHTQDWTHPGGGVVGGKWDNAQRGDAANYLTTVAIPQIKEILTRFRPAIMWWDTPVNEPVEAAVIHDLLKLCPEIITNDRLGGGYEGDFKAPVQFSPFTMRTKMDWEAHVSMNDTWGHKPFDNNYKSAETLLRSVIQTASNGGNFLLNISPTDQGIIPPQQIDRLKFIGNWLKVNGRAIYGTTAGPYRRLSFDGCTTVKDNVLYLHVFKWPESELKLPGLETPIVSANALATGQRLTTYRHGDGGREIARPEVLDPVATVIELKLSGPPVVNETAFAIEPDKNGVIALRAKDASLTGSMIVLEGMPDAENIGYWMDPTATVHWYINVPDNHAPEYRVEVEFSCFAGMQGSRYAIEIDDGDTGVDGFVSDTTTWENYRTVTLEKGLTLKPGIHKLQIVVLSKPSFGIMNLRTVSLLPFAG